MYKELAKYWISFVPVTALLGLGVALAPTAEQLTRLGFAAWLQARGSGLAVALALSCLALVAMTVLCARVLAAEPTEFGKLLEEDNATWLSTAFSRYGVGRPYFLDSTKFLSAELECRVPDDKGGFDPRAAAVNEVTARIAALSADVNAKCRFTAFAWVFGLGAVLITGTALFALGSPPRGLELISEPVPVTVHIPAGEVIRVTDGTGCGTPAEADAVAVGGTWEQPRLRFFGAGCADAEWTPSTDLHILVTQK